MAVLKAGLRWCYVMSFSPSSVAGGQLKDKKELNSFFVLVVFGFKLLTGNRASLYQLGLWVKIKQ